jgi:hypothetical protein
MNDSQGFQEHPVGVYPTGDRPSCGLTAST